MESLNSRMPLPSDLPTSGRRFGPSTRSAMTSTMTNSIGPMLLNGMDVPFGVRPSSLPAVSLTSKDERVLGVRREDRRRGHRDLGVGQVREHALIKRDEVPLE